MHVACFSVATIDFYPQQGKYYPGGNALNQAIRFGQMGHHSAFVGALGTDPAGDQIAALLAAESIDVSYTYRVKGRTATNQIIVDDSGERYGVEARRIPIRSGRCPSFRRNAVAPKPDLPPVRELGGSSGCLCICSLGGILLCS